MGNRRILLFADGSPALGAGHMTRCAALATALAARGDLPTLACRSLPDSLHGWAWGERPTHLRPAGESPRSAIRAAAAATDAEVVVVDHYEVTGADLAAIAGDRPVAVLDDAAERDLSSVALVVHPGPGAGPEDYPGVVTASGMAHALVGRPGSVGAPERAADSVVVCLGATDAAGLLEPVVEALLDRTALTISVYSGPGLRRPRLAAWCRDLPDRCRWIDGADSAALARAFAGAGLAVVTASTVALEALACGASVIALRTAANQDRLANGLATGGVPVVRDALRAGPLIAAVISQGLPPVGARPDGVGALRAAERVAELAHRDALRDLRGAVWSDLDLLLGWANEPTIRSAGFHPDPVTREEHLRWFRRRLQDADSRLWIASRAGIPAGLLRLQRVADAAEVGIAVDPAQRGHGVAVGTLASLSAWNAASGFCRRLVAWIRAENAASIAAFTRAGYRRIGSDRIHGFDAVQYVQERA